MQIPVLILCFENCSNWLYLDRIISKTKMVTF